MKPYQKITLIYVLLGILWIYFSDEQVVLISSLTNAEISTLQTYKGMLFVLITGSLLFWLLWKNDRKIQKYIQDLKNKQAEINLLFESEHITWIKLTESEEIQEVSNKFLQLTGYSIKEVVGRHYSDFLNPEEQETVDNIIETLRSQKLKNFNVELEVPAKHGEMLWFNFIGTGVYENGKLKNIIVLAQDVTRKRREDSERTKLLISGQERERERISMILHDSLAQILASMKMHIHAISGKNSIENQDLEKIHKMIGEGIKQTRDLSHDLRPPGFNEGVIKVLREYIRSKINAHPEIKFDFEIQGNVDEEDMKTFNKLNLYRMVQEIITNSINHSGGDHISLKIEKTKNYLQITVRDNGKGFNPKRRSGRGIGLLNVKNRAATDDIKCDFTTIPDEGTEMRLLKYTREEQLEAKMR